MLQDELDEFSKGSKQIEDCFVTIQAISMAGKSQNANKSGNLKTINWFNNSKLKIQMKTHILEIRKESTNVTGWTDTTVENLLQDVASFTKDFNKLVVGAYSDDFSRATLLCKTLEDNINLTKANSEVEDNYRLLQAVLKQTEIELLEFKNPTSDICNLDSSPDKWKEISKYGLVLLVGTYAVKMLYDAITVSSFNPFIS